MRNLPPSFSAPVAVVIPAALLFTLGYIQQSVEKTYDALGFGGLESDLVIFCKRLLRLNSCGEVEELPKRTAESKRMKCSEILVGLCTGTIVCGVIIVVRRWYGQPGKECSC